VEVKNKNKQISTAISKVTRIKNLITFKKKSKAQIKIKEFLKKNQLPINSSSKVLTKGKHIPKILERELKIFKATLNLQIKKETSFQVSNNS